MANSEAVLAAAFGRPDENGAFAGVLGPDKQAKVKYWRKPDGWIERGPEVNTDAPKYQQFIRKGWKELPDFFGREIMGQGTIFPRNPFPRGQEHFWLETFFKNGGHTYICKPTDNFGKEGEFLMPVAQLISMRMHRLPDMLEARPDLKEAVELPCPYGCVEERTGLPRQFVGQNAVVAESSRDQHIVAVHKDAVASRAVGDTIAKAMNGMQGQPVNADLIAAIVAATVSALKPAETQAVAAVAQGWMPPDPTEDVSISGELLPLTSDNVGNVTQNVTLASLPSRQDLDSWTRPELMSWAAKHKHIVPYPEKPFSLKHSEWRAYLTGALYPAA